MLAVSSDSPNYKELIEHLESKGIPIDQGKKTSFNVIEYSIIKGYFAMLETGLKDKQNLQQLNKYRPDEMTPIDLASLLGDAKAVELLLPKTPDRYLLRNAGSSVYSAALRGYEKVVREFLLYYKNNDQCNYDFCIEQIRSAYQKNQNESLAKVLQENGVALDKVNSDANGSANKKRNAHVFGEACESKKQKNELTTQADQSKYLGL